MRAALFFFRDLPCRSGRRRDLSPRPRGHPPDRAAPLRHPASDRGAVALRGCAHTAFSPGHRLAGPRTTAACRIRALDLASNRRLRWRVELSGVLPDGWTTAGRVRAV